jgi:hypothetical protein
MSDLHLDRRALLLAGAGAVSTAAVLTFEPAVAGTTTTKRFTGSFSSSDQLADWYYLPFRVPAGVRRISVSYTYRPTQVGPTTLNVVDIGIFGPTGFRGWSGGARREFSLGSHSATPGYLAGPVQPGRWRVALGPYQITATGTPYEVVVTLHHGEPAKPFRPKPAPTAVAGTGQGWYRGDLHVHTVHSDGSQTQAEVLADARAAGLDFIGSSEHNTDSAQLTWGRYVDDDFLVIPGEEVTTRTGHWLATGLPAGTWIDWRYRPEDDRLATYTQQVRDAGGIAIAAHPFQAGTGIGWGFGTDFTEVDAVEVWNGPWGSDDDRTVTRWHELLTAGTFKPAVGNSDSHNHGQTIGLAQTVVRAESLSVDALVTGYRLGHSWIAESSAVDLRFTATLDDVSGECGDRVPSGTGQDVAVHLEATGVDGCVATLLGPGTANVLGTAAATGGAITLDAAVPGGTAFVRAEIRRGTAMVALTNPIFLS